MRVSAPARLHLGFLDPDGALGRKFGSIGLAIDHPATRLTVKANDRAIATGPEQNRVLKLLADYAAINPSAGNYAVTVETAIPAHAGLGSGTQLALAVGAGVSALARDTHSSEELARISRRGARSGIGVGAFETGGFLIDGGRGPHDGAPPITLRAAFPDDWRVVLIFDPNATGVHGQAEIEAFASLPPFGAAAAGRVCHLALMQLLPGLAEHDIAVFGAAITEIQRIAGRHFASAQGGSAWASPAVEKIALRLGELGAAGIGQSSWGPTGFAFVDGEKKAEGLYAALVGEAKATGLDIVITRGRNTGALIERI